MCPKMPKPQYHRTEDANLHKPEQNELKSNHMTAIYSHRVNSSHSQLTKSPSRSNTQTTKPIPTLLPRPPDASRRTPHQLKHLQATPATRITSNNKPPDSTARPPPPQALSLSRSLCDV
uniref:Uncharacterized protein n=1 Tax=Physcomitrium patens TaxID=3218 RepID=A0A2K1K886_PHYPA|nr:hypothetical protein PHYPA_011876 [Physcomitrium patens]